MSSSLGVEEKDDSGSVSASVIISVSRSNVSASALRKFHSQGISKIEFGGMFQRRIKIAYLKRKKMFCL